MQSNQEISSLPDPAVPGAANAAMSDSEDKVVQLNFEWKSLSFEARLDRETLRESHLYITCDLGPVPFTAEGVQRRTNVFAVLAATRTGMKVRTSISRKQRIILTAETKIAAPVTTNSLIAGITTLLALARPYIELIDVLQQSADSVRTRH